jgi:hypothetical protein
MDTFSPICNSAAGQPLIIFGIFAAMASLKAFLPQLAKIVDTTADTLYSRQRALTQMGLLKAVEGRGPGSGVPLSGEAVAAMIIALMASDSLLETDQRVARTCNAVASDGSCVWTGAATFQSALAAVLLSEERVTSFMELTIARGVKATIQWDPGHSPPAADSPAINYLKQKAFFRAETSTFNIHRPRGRLPVFHIAASLNYAQTIPQISKAVRSALGDSK